MSVEAKKAKQVVIDEIKERFEQAQSVVVVDYLGLTVAEADEMRKNLREGGVSFTVYKNTLVKRAHRRNTVRSSGRSPEGFQRIRIQQRRRNCRCKNPEQVHQAVQEDGVQGRCSRGSGI